jgi:hypothetical protein
MPRQLANPRRWAERTVMSVLNGAAVSFPGRSRTLVTATVSNSGASRFGATAKTGRMVCNGTDRRTGSAKAAAMMLPRMKEVLVPRRDTWLIVGLVAVFSSCGRAREEREDVHL